MSDTVNLAAEALRTADVPPLPEELRTAAVAAGQGYNHTRTRRCMMRIGIGAALAAGVLVGAGVLWNGGSSAAAQVAAAAEKAAKATSYRQIFRENGVVTTRLIVTPDVVRLDSFDSHRVELTDFAGRKMLKLDARDRTARWYTHSADNAEELRQSHAHATRMLELARVPSSGFVCTEQPREALAGRPVRVFDLTNGLTMIGTATRLWVDAATDLPVRERFIYRGNEYVVDYEAWNEKPDPALLTLEVPSGYTEMDGYAAQPDPAIALLQGAFAKARAAKSVRFQNTVVALTDGSVTADEVITLTPDAVRIEERKVNNAPLRIIDLKERVELSLDPRDKTYRESGLTPREAAAERKMIEAESDPLRYWKGEGASVRRLRRDEWGGKPADVYQVDYPAGAIEGEPHPAGTYTVWIDAATQRPLRSLGQNGRGVASVTVYLGWDEDLDPKLFSLDVPPGYTLVEGK